MRVNDPPIAALLIKSDQLPAEWQAVWVRRLGPRPSLADAKAQVRALHETLWYMAAAADVPFFRLLVALDRGGPELQTIRARIQARQTGEE